MKLAAILLATCLTAIAVDGKINCNQVISKTIGYCQIAQGRRMLGLSGEAVDESPSDLCKSLEMMETNILNCYKGAETGVPACKADFDGLLAGSKLYYKALLRAYHCL